MNINNIFKIISSYNPLRLHDDELMAYHELSIAINRNTSSVKKISYEQFVQIFIDNFGDVRVLFNMKNNNNIYNNIYRDIFDVNQH